MTHLPLEDRNVWGVPGPKYEPVGLCAHPFCDCVDRLLERHHLWPKSFLRQQPTEYVKLPDGRIVQNCVYLCREHHQQITENKARIQVEKDHGEPFFMWYGAPDLFTEISPLSPQPRFLDADSEDVTPRASRPAESLAEPHSDIPEGTECPACHRRVPKKRKPTTPTSKVHSFRGPLDQADNLDEILEATAKHLGIYESSFWKHEAILRACVIALQEPGEG